MKRALLAALLVMAVAPAARAGGTTTWPGDGDAATHFLYHLGDPTASPNPATAAFRLGDFPQIGTPCLLQANGGNALPSCSSLTGFTAHAPLLLIGPDLTLTLSDGTLSVNASALRRAAIGGDTIIPLGSNTSTFRTGTANSVLGRSGVTPGAIVDLSSSTTGDAFWNNGTGIQWSPYPYADLAGAPSSLPPSGSASNDLGGTYPGPTVLAAEFGAQRLSFSTTADGALLKRSGTTVAPAVSGTDYVITVRADGITTGTLQLASISAATMLDGAVAWVDSVGDFYRLAQSTLTTTPLTVIAASGKAGYVWQRLGATNKDWAARTAWWIDPANASTTASDENTGASSGLALRTFAELGRRLTGATFNQAAINVTLMNNAPSSDPLLLVGVQAGSTLPSLTVTGVPTVIASGRTISTPRNPALTANDHFEITDGTATFTPWIQNYILHRTNGTPAWFWPYKDLGSGHLQISPPINPANISVIQTLSNGDTYEVLQLPTFADVFVAGATGVMFVQLSELSLIGSTAVGSQFAYPTGLGGLTYDRVLLNSSVPSIGVIQGSVTIELENICLPASAGGAAIQGPVAFWGGLLAGNGTTTAVEYTEGYFLGGSQANVLTLGGAQFQVVHDGRAEKLAFMAYDFGAAWPAVTVTHLARSWITTIGGERNAGELVTTDSTGSVGSTDFSQWNSAATSDARPYNYAGITYTQAQLGLDTNHLATSGGGIWQMESGAWAGDLSGNSAVVSVIGLTGGATDHPIDALTSGQALTVSTGTGHIVSAPILAAPGSNGIAVWNGSAFLGRTLTNGDGTINFTNPDGIAGNPEIHVNAIPESKVTNLVTDLAARVLTTTTLTITAPGTIDGGSSADLSTNRTIAFPVFAGSTAGLVPSSGGSSTAFLNGAGSFSTPAGTIYTGTSPIIVNAGTHDISCPTCGTSSGSVTGVFGTPGQIIVSPSTPNPTVSLPNVGPGATTTGSAGIASVTTDAQGRIVSMTTNSYQPAMSFPLAHYVLDSTGSGVTGDVSFQRDPITNMVSAIGMAINGAGPFPNSALIVNSATNPNRDRIQLFLGGGGLPAAGPTGDSSLLGIFPHDTAVEAGVTSGIYSTFRARPLTYTGSGQVITEAAGGYFEQPILSGVSGLTFALHAVGTSLITGDFGATGTVSFQSLSGHGPGVVTNDTFGDLRTTGSMPAGNVIWDGAGNMSTSSGALMYSKDYYFDIPNASLNSTGNWLATSSPTVFSSTPIDYKVPFAVNSVHMFIGGIIISNPLTGGGFTPNIGIRITKNGTSMSGHLATFGVGVSGNFLNVFVSTDSFVAGDNIGVEIIAAAGNTYTGANFTGTVSIGWDQQQ